MLLAIFNKIHSAKFFVNIENKNQLLHLIKQRLSKEDPQPLVFNYVYVGSLYYALTDKIYWEALVSADHVLLDGFLVGWVLKLFYGKKINRIGSEHYVKDLLSYCALNHIRVFLLGGGRKSMIRIRRDFPNLEIANLYGPISLRNMEIAKQINQFKTDLLIVALGLGKQEKWIYLNRNQFMGVKVITAIGFYGAILGQEGNLPPKILDELNMRWLYKLIKEPKRLWKRYVFGLVFLMLLINYIIAIKLLRTIGITKT